MKLEDMRKEYDRLQLIHGDPSLDSIYNGGCTSNPDIMFVFMNLFDATDLIDKELYEKIKSIKGSDWTPEFAKLVYDDVTKHRFFINNLGKCTQIDARPLPDSVYLEYLELLKKEIEIVDPKVVILFGNQVSSIVLGQNISVSKSRKTEYPLHIGRKTYRCFPVFYPVGNGRFNIDKSIEDINWIKSTLIEEGGHFHDLSD